MLLMLAFKILEYNRRALIMGKTVDMTVDEKTRTEMRPSPRTSLCRIKTHSWKRCTGNREDCSLERIGGRVKSPSSFKFSPVSNILGCHVICLVNCVSSGPELVQPTVGKFQSTTCLRRLLSFKEMLIFIFPAGLCTCPQRQNY